MLCSIPAYAVETRASSRIAHSAVSLSKKSTGDLSVYFSVQATDVMEKIGASSVEIQRNTILGWVTEYAFTPDNAPEIQAENKFQHSATLTYSPLFSGKRVPRCGDDLCEGCNGDEYTTVDEQDSLT